MTPRGQETVVAATLDNVRDGSAVDLKMEGQIPPKVRGPQNNKTPTRLGGGSDRRYANKNENEKECGGGGVSWLHRRMLCSGFVLASPALVDFWTLLVDCPCPAAGRPCRPAKLPLLPGGYPRPGWAEKNEIRIPPRSKYIRPSRLDVHCCRSGPGIPCAW
jgi:hypothetical protein